MLKVLYGNSWVKGASELLLKMTVHRTRNIDNYHHSRSVGKLNFWFKVLLVRIKNQQISFTFSTSKQLFYLINYQCLSLLNYDEICTWYIPHLSVYIELIFSFYFIPAFRVSINKHSSVLWNCWISAFLWIVSNIAFL